LNRFPFSKAMFLAALAMASASLITGCGGAKKIVAHVNQDSITEDEYNERAANVNLANLAASYQVRGPIKAGEFAIMNLVLDKLVLQLGAEKKIIPTDAQINAYVAFAKKNVQHPQFAALTVMPADPFRTDAEWRRDAKLALVRRAIAMAPLKITDADVKKTYDESKTSLTPPDVYHLRLIDTSSPQKAQTALDMLKSGVSFETVALKLSEEPNSRAKSGDIGELASTQLPPALLDAVKDLKPNEYSAKMVKVSPAEMSAGAAPPTATAPHYMIPQLVEKKSGITPSLEESRYVIERNLIEQKDRNAFQRVSDELQKFKDNSKVDIQLKGMEHLMDKKPQAAIPTLPNAAPGGPAPGAP
jgi:parvulin-like peptidyl-prolyl isomerase